MGIGKRIKEARENLGLTQTELGELIGVTGSAITNYEKETSHPKESIMYKLFEALNVDANYLFQDVVNIPKKVNDVTLSEFEHIKKYRILDSHGRDLVDMVLNKETERMETLEKKSQRDSDPLEFPTLDSEQPTRTLNYYQRLASAGTGQIVFDDVPVDLIEIPDIPEYNRVKFAVGVNGDSMEPLYYDGDILLVEPMPDVRVDEIGIFIVDGESLVKKRGKKSLISLNKKKNYPEIPFTEETRCLGRVVDKISTPDSAYSKLESEDLDALEKGMDLLFSQSVGSKKEAIEDSEIGESMDKAKTVLHPDISALDPDDIAALENGQIKMFNHGKKA